MSIPSAAIGFAEIALSRYLAAADIGPLADELIGKVIRVELEMIPGQPPLTIDAMPDQGGIRLLPIGTRGTGESAETESDATIAGSPPALLRLLLNRSDNTSDQARLSGDLQLIRSLSEQLAAADVDLEAILAEWTGPQRAYHLAELSRKTSSWLKQSSDKLSRNLFDYLKYESDLLVAPQQWQQLVEETQQLERRIGGLIRRLEKLNKPNQPKQPDQ